MLSPGFRSRTLQAACCNCPFGMSQFQSFSQHLAMRQQFDKSWRRCRNGCNVKAVPGSALCFALGHVCLWSSFLDASSWSSASQRLLVLDSELGGSFQDLKTLQLRWHTLQAFEKKTGATTCRSGLRFCLHQIILNPFIDLYCPFCSCGFCGKLRTFLSRLFVGIPRRKLAPFAFISFRSMSLNAGA